ncbi:MAG: 4'-phosphopantetheinyl transferase superfamily protein [Sulfitobacter sp.]
MAELDIPIPPTLKGAVAKRKGEYRAGRTCAQEALAGLSDDRTLFEKEGIDWPVIGSDRAPIWPAGVTGTLTHTDICVLCVVGFSAQFSGIGVDLEIPARVQAAKGVAETIGHPEEYAKIAATPWQDIGGTLLFSAKEAMFKAIYPTVQRFVGFEEVRLRSVSGSVLTFDIQPQLCADLPDVASLTVSATRWQDQVLTFCARPIQKHDATATSR